MTDPNAIRPDTLGDDIAFMRTLAEAGRSGPLAGGSILLASGLSFGSASLAVWAGVSRHLLHQDWQVSAIWFASMAVFLTYLFASKAFRARRAGTSRAVGMAWSGAGWSIFFVGLSLAVMAAHGKDPYVANAFLPFILCIYGSAWFVAAALTQTRWLFVVAFAAFGMALVNAWFAAAGIVVFLVYALSLYALVAAPGAALMVQARKANAVTAAA